MAKRISRKKGQKRNSKKHSDLYTDENPKGTIKGLKFATVKDAEASVRKIKSSTRSHNHKTQAAIAMEQRAKAAGKKSAAGVYRKFIEQQKKKTAAKNEAVATKKSLYLDRPSMHVDDYDVPVVDQISNWMKDMKLIRECVRNILISEGMTSPNSVAGKYAVWADISSQNTDVPDGTEINFLMYDWSKAHSIIKDYLKPVSSPLRQQLTPEDISSGELVAAIEDAAVACMRVRTYGDGMGCNSAWEVVRSAADSGLGPTIYDMVMSIAPYGLIADRSQVSSSARKVWSYYANNRSSVDKDFLDPSGYTDTEWDDCDVHGGRSDPLRTATRLMAVQYFDDTWPYEHGIFKEKAEMSDIIAAGGSDGDRYFEIVSKWIEENQADHDIDEWNMDEANDSWYDWKTEGELELMDKLDNDFKFEDPDYLNLSYNTNYAVGSFEEMEENHNAFVSSLEEIVPGAEDLIYEDSYALHFAVRNFFNERA
jgi:hypothetical protein